MKRIARRVRKGKETGGQDALVFGLSQRPLPVEISMRSGDHPARPVREEKKKKDERTVVSFLSLPRIWDIFAS